MRNLLIALACCVPANVSAQEAVGPRAGFQTSSLQDVGPWGAAALPEGVAPLPSDLWRGANPATLALLFAKISPDQRFPSLQSLTRQAIFSGGAAPTTDPDIARARFEAASRFGPAEAAARLVFGVPRLASQPDLAAIAVDAGLRVGRIDEACNLIEAVTGPPEDTAWLESRATCYALNNEGAAANLSVDLAKTRGLTDTWLSRAIAAVAAPLTAPPPFRIDSGRALALSLKAKLKVPVTMAANPDPAALSALMSTPDFMAALSPEERVMLAQNGAVRGVVSLDALMRYRPAPDPAIVLPPVPAQIVQKLMLASSLAARALEARMAIGDLKMVMQVQPGLITLSEVPILTEAALWAGEGALAASIANLSPEALDPRLALVLALYDPSKQAQIIEQRIHAAGADPVAQRIAVRDALMAWSAGLPVGGEVSLLIQTGLPSGPAGNASLRAALDLAASRGSKGEVILLTALALQGTDPGSSDPETLSSALKALRRGGLPVAARDLARDYLLATYVTLPQRPITRPRAASPNRERSRTTPVAAPPAVRTPAAPIEQMLPTEKSVPRPSARQNSPPALATTPPRIKPSWGTP